MADERPVPTAEFERALEGLDTEALATFVGELRSAAGEQVEVDGPVVTLGTGDDQTRLYVVPAGGEPPATRADVDAVVIAETDTGTLETADTDHRVVGPASLRQRLLYGLDSRVADRLCRRFLGTPARSTHHTPEDPGTAAGDGSAREEAGSGDGESARSGSEAGAAAGSTGDGSPPGSRPTTNDTGPRGGGEQSAVNPGSEPDDGAHSPSGPGGSAVVASLADSPWIVVAAIVVLALAAGSGATLVADAGLGGEGTAASEDGVDLDDDGTEVEMNPPTDGGRPAPVPEGTPTAQSTVTATPSAAGRASDGGNGTLASERYANPVPTCNRSYLHVVQIQMNALKYNDAETDDGIRTVRRFASPDNRELVGTFEQFVEIIESPTYAPMLSYDSATFEPERTAEDTALVRVTTRASGNVTARYEFRLARQDGGRYDGCWMTDGVQALDAGV